MTAGSLGGLAFVHCYTARHEPALDWLVTFNPGVAQPREINYVAHKRPATNPHVAALIDFLRSAKRLPSIQEILSRDETPTPPISGN